MGTAAIPDEPQRLVERSDRSIQRGGSGGKQLPRARTPHERESIQRHIAATDGQVDALVYELYGLTKAEIRVVEGAADGLRRTAVTS